MTVKSASRPTIVGRAVVAGLPVVVAGAVTLVLVLKLLATADPAAAAYSTAAPAADKLPGLVLQPLVDV